MSDDLTTPTFPPREGPWGYFTQLEIENVRCFGPRQTLNLSHPDTPDVPARWTVILGENGTGKTTLLQAIMCMVPGRLAEDLASMPLLSFSKHMARMWGLHDDYLRGSGANAYLSLGHYACSKHGEALKTFRGLKTFQHAELDRRSFVITQPLDETGHAKLLPEFPCFAYGSSRKINEIRTSDEFTAEEGYETLFSESVGLTDPAELFSQTYLVTTLGEDEESKQRAREKLERLRRALVDVLPDVADVTIEVEKGRPVVLFETNYGRVRSSQLSSGYRAMAAWVGDLVGRMFDAYPDSEDPLAEPAVVLVDEFDLHMHPRWQRESVAFLTRRFPATQFIVTAHSPLVVQSAPEVNIALLRREGDHVVIDNDPAAVSTWRIDQILTSELFGLESARSEDVQALLDEHARLLAKRDLSADEQERLAELDRRVDEIPFADSPAAVRAEQMLAELTDELERRLAGSEP